MVSTIRYALCSTSLFMTKHDYVPNKTKTNSLMYMHMGLSVLTVLIYIQLFWPNDGESITQFGIIIPCQTADRF